MIGIYKITSPNDRFYIGQSVNIEKRFLSYKNLHKRNNKLIILYRSFLKYGVENHVFEIIDECDIELLNERERYWQDYYNVLENGLNCRLTKTNDRSGKLGKEIRAKIGLSKIGNKYFLNKKHSQETKYKISLGNTGKRHSEEVNKSKGRKGKTSPMKGVFSDKHHRSIKVLQFDLNDNFIKEWNCLMDIKRELNFHIGNVSSCLKGNLKTYKKYKWKYKN